MSISCSINTALTDSEVNQDFGGDGKQGLLMMAPRTSSEREENGMLKQTSIKSLVESLNRSGVIPTPNVKDVETFVKRQEELISNIQAEYCFYHSRYRYALEKLLMAIRQAYLDNTADNQATIQKYLSLTQSLNQKLNDLLQIINGVTEEMLKTNSDLLEEIKKFNRAIKEQQQKLQEQNKIIMSNDAVTKLNKEMVKYTEEKGRYTDNLLKMYSVLNIVALGLLIYVYKSAN